MHGFIACSPRLCADLLQLKINANIMHKSECQNQHICSRYSLVCVCVCQCTRRRSCEGFARVACEPSEIQRKRNILPKSLGGCKVGVASGWCRIGWCFSESKREKEASILRASLGSIFSFADFRAVALISQLPVAEFSFSLGLQGKYFGARARGNWVFSATAADVG